MDVSVIFATHNRADILSEVFEAWKAVDRVTKYSYEIICSDDESTDDTVNVIKQTEGLPIRLIQNKKGGASKARNAALKIATGRLIIFTGDDIFPNENFINMHFENFLKFGEKTATLGRIDWHEDIKLNHLMKHITEIGCEQFGFIALPSYQLIDFRHFYTSNISVSSSLLYSLDKWFNTDFDKYGFEDIELGYRLQKNGMKIYYDPDVLAYHHHVYDSCEKFCKRQISAGEELVVFHHMHDDLEDKCNCDVDDCIAAFRKYSIKCGKIEQWKGLCFLKAIELGKFWSVILEKWIKKSNSHLCEVICSAIYAIIFKISFFYGVTIRIALEENAKLSDAQLMCFTISYINRPSHQIYWNTGWGLNEMQSRKWKCWDDSEVILEQMLPKDVCELRITPLKGYCRAYVKSIEFLLKDGSSWDAEIDWHNACKNDGNYYDFKHTNDSMILIKKIPEDYSKIRVRMRVKYMLKHKSMLKSVRSMAGKMLRRMYAKKHIKQDKWQAEYAYGQKRRIQIGIGGEMSVESKTMLIDAYRNQCAILGADVKVSDITRMEPGYINYIYCPVLDPLDNTQFLQVVYTLLNSVVDYVLISKAFTDFPSIACQNIYDSLIYSAQIDLGENLEGLKSANGRYMRLPGFKQEKQKTSIKESMPWLGVQKEYYLNTNKIEFKMSDRVFGNEKSQKPLVFVIPVFLAVGGVERNTIEVMKYLKEKYDFCLITLERHAEQQGSLHYQLKDICKYIFDLREITEHANFLNCMFELKKMFNPRLVWFCNNSPWLEKNLVNIRSIFSDVPVIMQDVYDTKMGWIEYYDRPIIKTMDRYIAVTELIKETFIKKYNLPEQKIDVIYSVVNDEQIKRVKSSSVTYEQICEKYGLDKQKEHYAYVGRFTEQKNPLRYLKLVENASKDLAENIQFVMVGDGIMKDEVDNFIAKHHISNLVRIPYVANTPELIGSMEGLILTSDYEGLPIVGIEAMGMGTPIFSTDSGDTKRFVERNVSGLIINDKKSDRENFDEFRANWREYKDNAVMHSDEMIEFFSVRHIGEQYIQTFENALIKKRDENL